MNTLVARHFFTGSTEALRLFAVHAISDEQGARKKRSAWRFCLTWSGESADGAFSSPHAQLMR